MDIVGINNACEAKACPAKASETLFIFFQGFRFCQHHYNKIREDYEQTEMAPRKL